MVLSIIQYFVTICQRFQKMEENFVEFSLKRKYNWVYFLFSTVKNSLKNSPFPV